MSRNVKNIIKIRNPRNPKLRREDLKREPLRESTPLPKPLTYEDYDKAFKKWVEDELYISYDGKALPTFSLFSNQKFSEYMQTWKHVDENKNPILNFKTIRRENNPQSGTLYGEVRNIPGDRSYTIKKVFMTDENDRGYFLNYKMKQPFCIDLEYNLSIFTNKLEAINAFNELVNDKFKALNTYMVVNGHYIGMKLESISDDSSYDIDDRQYYSQGYDITVMAYIITEDSYSVEESPMLKFLGFEGEKSRKMVEIEEPPCYIPENHFYNKPCNLNITLGVCDEKLKFIIDTDLVIEEGIIENVKYIKWYVNDVEYDDLIGLELKNNDEIRIGKVIRKNVSNEVKMTFKGYVPNVLFDDRKDNPEFEEDRTQFGEEIIIK